MAETSKPSLDGCTTEVVTEFEHPHCQRLYGYWLECCELTPDIGPQHANFELSDIIECAPYLIYKEVINGGEDFRNRYWGTEVGNFFGPEATGKTLRDYYTDEILAQTLMLSNFVISARHAVKISGKPKFVNEDKYTNFEACYLPLYDSTGSPARLIAAFDIFS